MTTLIDREELIKDLNHFAPEHYNALVNKIIQNQTAVDAVEAVRCKDCLNYKETMRNDSGKQCGYGRCLHPSGLKSIVFDQYFCPFGERRTDG